MGRVFINARLYLLFLLLFNTTITFSNTLEKPDRLELMKLFHARHYGELIQILDAYQSAYENEGGDEHLIENAYCAFCVADPGYEKLFEEWITKYPDSYVPYLARGKYYDRLGYILRGTEYARDTSKEQFSAMKYYHEKAYADYMKALELKPKLTIAYAGMINLSASSRGGKSKEELLQKGLSIDPASYEIRFSYLYKLMPRWGGSYEQIDAFLKDVEKYVEQRPSLAPLLGFADYVRGYNYHIGGDIGKAIEYYTRALQHGESTMYLKERGMAYTNMRDYKDAIKDLNHALEIAPQFQSALVWRGIAYTEMRKFDEAMMDLNLALKLDPFDYMALKNRGYLFAELNKYDDAVDDMRNALHYTKTDWTLWSSLGTLLMRLNKSEEAAEAFKVSIKINPGSAYTLYNYGSVLNELKKCEAVPVLAKYLSVCQGNEESSCHEGQRNIAIKTIASMKEKCNPESKQKGVGDN